MRNFIVTKHMDKEAHYEGENDTEVHPGNDEPPKARVATRVLFLLLLTSGAILISSGVSVLVTCRHNVSALSCGIALCTEPCSHLAISAYFGCVLIIATIFGFGCVGRKAMAVVLVPLLIGEIAFGIYLLMIGSPYVGEAIFSDFSSRRDICLGIGTNITTMTATDAPSPGGPDVFHCWRQTTTRMGLCETLWSNSQDQCMEKHADRWTNDTLATATTDYNDTTLHSCANQVNDAIRDLVWHKMLIIGPLLLCLSVFHLLCAASLWFLRKSTIWERGLGMISIPTLPKPFSRSKCHVKSGSQDLESHQSLILHPDGTVINMQRYAIKKLRRQKNTYATV